MAREVDPGLCKSCTAARAIVSAKGSTFWLCQRASDDPRFRKYPPLPVLRCSGYSRVIPADHSSGSAVERP